MQKIKKVLIFGYGDLGSRVKALEANYNIKVYGVSRRLSENEDSLYRWDWMTNTDLPQDLLDIEWDAIVIILKPTSYDELGYYEGYCKGLTQLAQAIQQAQYRRVIFVSSTRVYSYKNNPIGKDTKPTPDDFRGHKILEAESLAIRSFANKLTILRFSGLYKDALDLSNYSPQTSRQLLPSENINRLSREAAASIIASVSTVLSLEQEVLICSEPTFNCKDYFESRFPDYRFNDSFTCKEQGKIFIKEALYNSC